MKEIIRSIILFICKKWSYIYPLSFSNNIKNIWCVLYSFWISRFFREFGERAIMKYPCRLLGCQYISVGDHVEIGKNSVITAWDRYGNQNFSPEISIGSFSSIGEYSHISAVNKIIIGKNVLTGRWTTIVDNAHGTTNNEMINIPPIHRSLHVKGPVVIGDNVWIGDKVTIVSGVTIGHNCIVGANSVVTKNIPANCLIGGNPAGIIKFLDK